MLFQVVYFRIYFNYDIIIELYNGLAHIFHHAIARNNDYFGGSHSYYYPMDFVPSMWNHYYVYSRTPLERTFINAGTSAANSSSTSHLFSHSSPNPGANAFLTSSSSSQSGYPSPQQSQQGYPGGVYSNSPSPSAPQAASPQQQVGSQPQQQVGNQPQPGSQQQQMGTQQQQGSQQQQQQQVGSQPDSSYYGYSQAYPTMGTQGPSASMYQPVMGYNYAYQAVPVPSSFPKQGQAYTQQGYSPYTM